MQGPRYGQGEENRHQQPQSIFKAFRMGYARKYRAISAFCLRR